MDDLWVGTGTGGSNHGLGLRREFRSVGQEPQYRAGPGFLGSHGAVTLVQWWKHQATSHLRVGFYSHKAPRPRLLTTNRRGRAAGLEGRPGEASQRPHSAHGSTAIGLRREAFLMWLNRGPAPSPN